VGMGLRPVHAERSSASFSFGLCMNLDSQKRSRALLGPDGSKTRSHTASGYSSSFSSARCRYANVSCSWRLTKNL
jgi:hypothetical protein